MDRATLILEFAWRLAVLTAIVVLTLASASPLVVTPLYVLLGLQKDNKENGRTPTSSA